MKLTSCFVLVFCTTFNFAQPRVDKGSEFSQYAFYLSEVMLHDVVNPPVASRFYAYSLLAAYQSIHSGDTTKDNITKTFVQDPHFQPMPVPQQWEKTFCAIYAMLEVGRQIIPSGYLLEERQKSLIGLYRKRYRFSMERIHANKIFAIAIASQIVDYSRADGYSTLSTLTRYTPDIKTVGHWYPTPPEYMSAVEPHWRTIRPFFLDSARQFSPAPPVEFSVEKDKPFYKLMHEVYETANHLTMEQREIAAFWDCNPFAVQYSGHLAMGLKKISPGGHWMGITGIACTQSSAPVEKTVEAYTLVALTLYDAFISCWDEKYTSDRIRPEAAINKYIDAAWKPLLQTPPFPEYTSGHSVISTAGALVLTFIFGDNFAFRDTTEEYFGLPARNFKSFASAADEAAISRLYGGIHFRDAIEQGQAQGRSIALHIIRKIGDRKTF